jgi:hypothetical protein
VAAFACVRAVARGVAQVVLGVLSTVGTWSIPNSVIGEPCPARLAVGSVFTACAMRERVLVWCAAMAAGSLIVALHRETLPAARVRALVSHPHLPGLLISSIVLSCVFGVAWLGLCSAFCDYLLRQIRSMSAYLASSCPNNPTTPQCVVTALDDPL